MLAFVAVVTGILGLAIGSFLNVVAYRVPLGKSVVHPPSACPACDTPIAWHDNIPVVSWFVLRGRCRACGEAFSFRYAAIEAATGLLFAATVLVVGLEWVLIGHLAFVAVTITLILTDLDHQRIPNRILYPGGSAAIAVLGVGALLDGTVGQFGRGLGGGVAYFAGLLLLALIAGGGFGMGDVKLGALLGVFTGFWGWGQVLVAAIVAFVGGGLVSLVLLALRLKGRKDRIPFGPYLVVGAWVAIAVGEPILDWWLGA